MCEMKCEEKATEEEEKEKAAGAELKTKTPHNDVGKNCSNALFYKNVLLDCVRVRVLRLVSSDFLLFDPFSSLLFSDFSHLCFLSAHIVRSLTSELPSIIR